MRNQNEIKCGNFTEKIIKPAIQGKYRYSCREDAGNSCAFSPICWDKSGNCVDNVLLTADALTEGLFYAEFDMDAIRDYREHEMMGNTFRKVKAYGELMSREFVPKSPAKVR